MSYLTDLEFTSSAAKTIRKLDKKTKKRLKLAVDKLREVPPIGDIKSLKGYSGILRCRVGDWRIIFKQDLENNKLIILDVDTRGDVYKKL
jgi:mRNA interferase RelE/StbE